MKQITMTVEVRVDGDTTIAEAREFVTNALHSYGGGLHPEDPFFGHKDSTVRSAVYSGGTIRANPREHPATGLR